MAFVDPTGLLTQQGGVGFPSQSAFGVPIYSGNGAANRLDPMGGLTPMPTMTGASTDPMVGQMVASMQLQTQILGLMVTMLMRLMMGQGQQQGAMAAMGGGGGASAGGAGGASAMGGSSSAGGTTNSGPSGPVAPGTAAMLQRAGSMVGMNENSDREAIKKVTGESGIDPATTPWCAAFAINMMKDAGTLDTTGLKNPNYCPEVMSWAKGKGIFQDKGSTPKPGDAILFDWQGDGTPDHIGLVEKVEGGKITTIEGNSSDSVKRNSYSVGDSKIAGYVQSK